MMKVSQMEKVEPSRTTSATLPFIVSMNTDKADATTRKLIRSHVRKGKGLRATSCNQSQTCCGADQWGRPEEIVPSGGYVSPLITGFGSDLAFTNLPESIDHSLVLSIAKGSLFGLDELDQWSLIL